MSKKQMNLGALIEALERKDTDLNVMYDFAYFVPTHFMSWRGDYSHLALGYASLDLGGKRITVEGLLKLAHEADGQTFTGYKGGEFDMSRRTTLWIANNGEACSTGIYDVIESEGNVILATTVFDYIGL